MNKDVSVKVPFAVAFSVGSVLFSAHAGGGFATGNQANTYYVSLGWLGQVTPVKVNKESILQLTPAIISVS